LTQLQPSPRWDEAPQLSDGKDVLSKEPLNPKMPPPFPNVCRSRPERHENKSSAARV